MEQIVTNPTVEFLLKQVYALHKQIVQDLENKIKSEQNENRNACKRCEELKNALADCKGSYFDALQQQKQQIDILEKRLSAVTSFKSAKNTRSIAIQTTEELRSTDAEAHVISTSNSSRSKKRQSICPIRQVYKKACTDLSSNASSTLLKSESPGRSKTIRIDFLPMDKGNNSLEREEPVVLVPESPLSENSSGERRLDPYDEIRLRSSHKKVTKWLENLEVPETVPLEDLTLPVATVDKESPSILGLGNEKNENRFLDREELPIQNVNRSPNCAQKEDVILKQKQYMKQDLPSSCPLVENLKTACNNDVRDKGSLIFNRKVKIESFSPLLTANHGLNTRLTRSEQKAKESLNVCGRGKKVLRQSKLKLKIASDKTHVAVLVAKPSDCLDFDCTLMPSSSRDEITGAIEDDKASKHKRQLYLPENKENAYLDSDDKSEDLLAVKDCHSDVLPEIGTQELSDISMKKNSFDAIPEKLNKTTFKVKDAPVKDRASRDKMPGHECDNCLRYYDNLDLPEEQRKERLKLCSKHRSNNALPATPEHYWEIGFPDTPECQERGYLNVTQKVQLRSRRRRPLK